MTATRIGLAVTGPPSRAADPVCDELTDRGHATERAAWDDPRVDWSVFDLVVVRSPSGYLERHQEFIGWANRTAMATEIWNPVELLRWNVHRQYLLDLASRDVDVLATLLVRDHDAVNLAALAGDAGWDRVVLKPATSAGGLGVCVVDVSEPEAQAHLEARQRFGDVIVQPYVESIHEEGELRLALVRGEAVAAARRLPSGADFGVQANKMAEAGEVDAPADAVAVAKAALKSLGRQTAHARADLLLVDGAWRLAELELVDPDRMLRDVPSALGALVDAIDDLAT